MLLKIWEAKNITARQTLTICRIQSGIWILDNWFDLTPYELTRYLLVSENLELRCCFVFLSERYGLVQTGTKLSDQHLS